MSGVLVGRQRWGDTETQGDVLKTEAEGAVTLHHPRDTWGHQELGEARRGPPRETSETAQPRRHRMPGFSAPEDKSNKQTALL